MSLSQFIYEKTLKYLNKSETLFDVGAGSGYFASIFVKNGKTSNAYCIDPFYSQDQIGSDPSFASPLGACCEYSPTGFPPPTCFREYLPFRHGFPCGHGSRRRLAFAHVYGPLAPTSLLLLFPDSCDSGLCSSFEASWCNAMLRRL